MDMAQNEAPNRVSCRVVKSSMPLSSTLSGTSTSSKVMRTPSDRPIQLRCIVRTLSGQRSKIVERRQEIVGIARNPEEPLGQLALLNRLHRSASRSRR